MRAATMIDLEDQDMGIQDMGIMNRANMRSTIIS